MGKLLKFNDAHYIHFVTTRTWKGATYFKSEQNCLILLKNITHYREKHEFKLLGYVIMPDHFHVLIEPKFVEDGINFIADGIKPSAKRLTSKRPGDGFTPSPMQADGMKPSARRSAEQVDDIISKRLGDGFTPSPIQADGTKSSVKQGDDIFSKRLGDGFTPSPIQADGIKSSVRQIIDEFIPSPIQNIIHDIKGKTAFDIRNYYHINDKIWQKSFFDVQIYSEKFLEQKLNYIHNNPIRAGLVKNLDDYCYSSYQNYYLNNHSLIKINY